MQFLRGRRKPSPVRNGQSGHALLMVSMFGVIALGVWVLAMFATLDAQLFESNTARRELRSEQMVDSVAFAGSLLRTGTPPRNNYECIHSQKNKRGEAVKVVLKFERFGGDLRWKVQARAATGKDIRRLPPAPDSF